MTELTADDIGETFVPRPRGDVSFVEVDNELVVAAPAGPFASDAHWLDRTASVVWQAFDGVTSVGSLVDELAAALVPIVTSRDDVLELRRTLGRAGLLDGRLRRTVAVHPLGLRASRRHRRCPRSRAATSTMSSCATNLAQRTVVRRQLEPSAGTA
jgi:hypothetical protein